MPSRATGATPTEPTFFASAAKFRAWLARHAATSTALVVGFHKVATGAPGISWPQAVDEALCVGWIDGVLWRVVSAKRPETQKKRLAKLIAASSEQRRLD